MPWVRPLPLESSARCADEVRILMNFAFVLFLGVEFADVVVFDRRIQSFSCVEVSSK